MLSELEENLANKDQSAKRDQEVQLVQEDLRVQQENQAPLAPEERRAARVLKD